MPTTHTVDCLFNLTANRTGGAKSAGFGLTGAAGGEADGPIGPLDGAQGPRKVEAGSIDRVP